MTNRQDCFSISRRRAGWTLAGLAALVTAGCAGPEPAARPDGGAPGTDPASGGGAGPATGTDGALEVRPIESRSFITDPQEERRGFNPLLLGEVSRVPLDPLRVRAAHQIHGLFYIPPMEGAETLEEGAFAFRLGLDVSKGGDQEVDSRVFYNFEGNLFETDWRFRYGLGEGTEVGASFDFGELFGSSEKIVLARDGKELVREGSRGAGIGDLVLALKKRLAWEEGSPEGFSVAVGVKIPVDSDRDNLLTSREVDTAIQAVYSRRLGEAVVAHADLGFMVPGRDKVFLEDVTLRDPLLFGGGIAWQASPDWVILTQLQGHQSVFEGKARSVDTLEGNLFSFHGGVRTRVGSYFLEAGLGTGLGDFTSSTVFTLGLEMRF